MELQDWIEAFKEVLHYQAVQVALTVIIAFIVQIVVRSSIDRIIKRAVRGHKYSNALDEEKREDTLATIFHTAIAIIIWTAAFFVVLAQLHINIAALMTGAGLLGVVVGFGAQNTIRDFLAGIFIILENQYRVSDIVTLNVGGKDVSGVVENITIRITRLRDLDGNLHIIPNGSAQIVTNLSFEYANVNIDVGVAYDADLDKVEKIMNQIGEAMAKDEKWAKHVFEPIQFLRVDGFEDSAIRIKALGKVEPAMQWELAGEYRRQLIEQFAKNHIEIPFPQRVIRQLAKNK